MPHIIIEHSANFSSQEIQELFSQIQNIMASIKDGNFDLEQCKARANQFDKYLVGSLNQEKSAFLHITIKIMQGRSTEVRKKLAEQVMNLSKKSYENFVFSSRKVDFMVSGMPHPQAPLQNSYLADKRCDFSVDIVEMDRETYQKFRIGE